MQKLASIFLLLLLSMQAVLAHGSSCGCSMRSNIGAGPIITIPAYTMPKGRFAVSLGSAYLNYGRISNYQLGKISRRKEGADDMNSHLSNTVSLSYGLTDKLSLTASYPFVINYDVREVEGGAFENIGGNSGLGDLNLIGQYKFYDSERYGLQSAFIAGLKLPTGATHRKADNGEYFEGHLQPGSGSWDTTMGLALSKQIGDFGLDFNYLYVLSTQGALDTDTGDKNIYNLALSYAINHSHDDPFSHEHQHGKHPKHKLHFLERVFPEHLFGQHLAWDLIMEANIESESAPSENGVDFDNHGGTTMFLSPGLRLSVNDNWFYNLSVGFPVIEALDGDQGGSDLQILFSVATSF